MRQTISLLHALWRDVPRYHAAIGARGRHYLALCNRGEALVAAPDGSGFQCDWRWTSELRAARLIPQLGRMLMRRALEDHPIGRADHPPVSTTPEIAFVIGHRGSDRLPLLLATLETIAAQQGVAVECIVVEQDVEARIRDALPPWVRYVHTPLRRANQPFCRSWAFNVGVEHASSDAVILHDNDMLVPLDYAATIKARLSQGWEVVNLKRFIFYLTRAHTARLLSARGDPSGESPESIIQNLEGGGSIAVSRRSYLAIGGFDEAFEGWGGEDVEFWERALTRRVWPYGSLPLVHLWHGPQPGKSDPNAPGLELYRQRAAIAPSTRIQRLLNEHSHNCEYSLDANRATST